MPKTKLVIFDFDGTIVDSEPLYDNAKARQNQAHDIEMSEEEHLSYVGISTTECMKLYKERHKLSEGVGVLTEELNRYYMELARSQSYVFPAMKDFIIKLRTKGIYKMAIASGTPLKSLREIVEIVGLKDYFDGIYSSQEVPNGKPSPDIFLHVASKFNMNPDDCLVIEDSIPGVKAAEAANMRCVAVPMEDQYLDSVFHETPLYTFPSSYHFSAKAMLRALEQSLI